MNSELIGVINNKVNLIRQIGSGGTSKVYLGTQSTDPNTPVAIKVINSKDLGESKYFHNEMSMLKAVKHPNVVNLIDGGEGIMTLKETGSKTFVNYLVLELVKFGELFDYIFFPQKGFGEEVGRFIFGQILDGLDACHKAGIVHRDMKTENIMLHENWQMKLADFGFASKTEGKKGTGLLYTALGTANYACPELLMRKPYYGVSSDVFSLGVSLFVIVTGKMPFKHAILEDPYYREIAKMNYDAYWDKLKAKVPPVSTEFKQLFCSMIAFDPSMRPSIEEIRAHKWVSGTPLNMERILKDFTKRNEIVQYKKEVQRKMEEQQKMNTKKFQVYKGGELIAHEKTPEDLELRELAKQDVFNPYILMFPKEENPASLFDYLVEVLNSKPNIDMSVRTEDKYEMVVGCKAEPGKDELNGDFVIAPVEALVEVIRVEDSLALNFSIANGTKFDFHNLFTEISNAIAKEKD